MSVLRRPSRPVEHSMFESESEIDFKCDYTIKHSGKITFGWKCVATMESYLFSLLNELDIKSRNLLPSCDSVCSDHGAHPPSYDEFLSINRTVLGSFCRSSKNCGFNVVVLFDFQRLVWTRDDGTAIGRLFELKIFSV